MTRKEEPPCKEGLHLWSVHKRHCTKCLLPVEDYKRTTYDI